MDGSPVCSSDGPIEEIGRPELEFLACYMRIRDPRRRELLFTLCKALADESDAGY